MCQYIGTDLSSDAERLRGASGGEPDRQFALHRPRQSRDGDLVPSAVTIWQRLTPPQLAAGLDVPKHDGLAVSVALWRQHEVVAMPPGGERERHPAMRQMVDH